MSDFDKKKKEKSRYLFPTNKTVQYNRKINREKLFIRISFRVYLLFIYEYLLMHFSTLTPQLTHIHTHHRYRHTTIHQTALDISSTIRSRRNYFDRRRNFFPEHRHSCHAKKKKKGSHKRQSKPLPVSVYSLTTRVNG